MGWHVLMASLYSLRLGCMHIHMQIIEEQLQPGSLVDGGPAPATAAVAAQAYLDNMASTGRFQRDVWFS